MCITCKTTVVFSALGRIPMGAKLVFLFRNTSKSLKTVRNNEVLCTLIIGVANDVKDTITTARLYNSLLTM